MPILRDCSTTKKFVEKWQTRQDSPFYLHLTIAVRTAVVVKFTKARDRETEKDKKQISCNLGDKDFFVCLLFRLIFNIILLTSFAERYLRSVASKSR